ncbi:hypothetical protein ACOQLP_32750, partial [Klebsiella pneumoniae]
SKMLDSAANNPIGLSSDVGLFTNMFGAAGTGIYTGLVAKPDQLLWAGVDTVVSPIAKFVNENLDVNDTSVEYIKE